MSSQRADIIRQNEERLKKLKERRDKQMAERGTVNEAEEQRRPADITKDRRNLGVHRENLSLLVMPTTPETYAIEVQCELMSSSIDQAKLNQRREDDEEPDNNQLLQPKERKRKEEKPQGELVVKPIKTLNEQELGSLLKSKHFSDFFNQSTKLLEKVLDGGDGDMLQLLLQDDMKTGQDISKDILTPTVKFFDANYTKNRVVTSVDWSPQIPELILASYSQNQEGNIKDHVGVILLWSLGLRTRPEFHCFCQSQITSACFYPYSNNTILGGCYNGQLLLWDLRTKSLPVQRTGLSSNGHKYPVYSLNVVGTQIANNVVSISNDGKLCIWDIKSLGSPIKSTKLQNKTEINVTCAEFPEGDVNNFYFGAQNGFMYKSTLHNSQAAQQKYTIYQGHNGPITALSINNPSSEYSALSGLVLSASFDWSMKLWSPKHKQYIRSFENSDDYIYDVDWNPSNPGLFASVNNEGYMDLWDLTSDVEVPLLHYKVSREKEAINKCKWNKEGSKIMTGDSKGVVNVFDLDKKFQKIEGGRIDDLENTLIETKEGS